jgi:hypothetical protein
VILRFGRCTVVIDGDSTLVTLPDGAEVPGDVHDTDECRETSRRLGYGDNVGRESVEHEACHVWLADLLGLLESPVMRAVASGKGNDALLEAEESAVMSLQRYANMVGVNLTKRLRDLHGVGGS